ncbi:hypothetical protein EJ06DRAFT_518755 [Trichodelitschia bisporula]|uniref:Uncharacterized protein n=1 Tax=Trichodelitschia bisporula TaxID=703511 RepID=A0A6G1I7P2_9PEZI|nr:hypothetical protein EJ06DRAFT_518755 [Trichodelitschia bisporula]
MSTLDSLGSLKSYISSTLKQLPKKTPAYNDLHRLRDVVVDLEILIYHPSYKSRQDSEHINSRISQIARLTRSDLQDFNALIQPSATPDRSRLRSSRDRILAHEDAFARLLDLIEGREDWQKLSPREPPAQLALTAGPSSSGAPSSARDSNSENASPRVSVSVPASPFQPTVEDCDDDTDEDAPQPAHYHLIRSDSDAATIRERPTQNANSPQPPPPTVVVRSATLISESDLPSTPQPQNPSPTSSINERLHPSQTPSPSAPSPSRSPAGSSRGRPPRAHHASIDRGTPTHADDYPHDDHQRRRKRASTASGLERPDREPRDRDREPRDRDLRDREPRDRDREARDRGREPRDRDRDPHDRDRDRDSRTDHSRTSSYAQTTPRHSPRSGPENALSRRSSQRSNVAAHRSPSAHYPPIPGAYPEGSNYWDAPEPTAGGEWGRSSSASSSSAAGVQGSSSKYGPDPRASLPTVLERGRAMPLSPRGGMASLSYPDDLPAGGGGLYDMPAAAGTQYVDFIGAGDFTLFDTPARTRSSSGRGGWVAPAAAAGESAGDESGGGVEYV